MVGPATGAVATRPKRSALSVAEAKKLEGQADRLRDVLGRSKSVSEEMITILSTFDDRLSMLETAMRPIQARTLAFRKAHANIDATIRCVEGVLERYEVTGQVEQRIKDGPRRDLDAYLEAVDRLRTGIEYYQGHKQYKASEPALLQAQGLMKEAMQMLEADFQQLLANNSKPMDPNKLLEAMPEYDSGQMGHTESDRGTADGTSTGTGEEGNRKPKAPALLLPTLVERLNDVARRMIENGAAAECTSVYREVRGSTLEMTMRRLGVEMVTRDDILRMQWEDLENKIGNWIQFIKICMVVVFPEERKLCYQVFKGLDPHREICFAEMGDRALTLLLSFGESIASSQKSPEKLFVLLDMYEAIRDIMPVADETFPGNACIPCREFLKSLQRQLAQISRDTFFEFEVAVEKDSTRTPVADGTVHPLTSYVINYVKFLFDYEATLRQLFEEAEERRPGEKAEGGAARREASSLRMEAAMLRIMSVLEENLEAKAKLYKEMSLTQLFLMNNKHYIVRSIRKSEQARKLVGDEWIHKHKKIVQQHQAMYQKLAWSKVVQTLGSSSEPINKTALKEKLKNFNAAIEEQHQKQVQWSIPDAELQKAVRLSIANVLLPHYREFLKRYSSLLALDHGGRSHHKNFKYTPDDMERMIGELFDGRVIASEAPKGKNLF